MFIKNTVSCTMLFYVSSKCLLKIDPILSYLLWSNTINTHQHYLSADVQRREVMIAESLFCKIMNRFFSSSSNMAKGRIQELGFLPSPPSTSTQYPTLSMPLCARFEAQIMTVLPSLMPSKDFDAKREAIRASLQVTVRGTGVVPPGTQVALFGSSMNNFGNNDAGTTSHRVWYYELLYDMIQ